MKLTDIEKMNIISCKLEHLNNGHYYITNKLRDIDQWNSYSSTYNVLKEAKLLGKKPQSKSPWKEPRYSVIKPNVFWLIDWTKLRLEGILWNVISIIDCYSRFIVGWDLVKTVSADDIVRVISLAWEDQEIEGNELQLKIRLDQHASNKAKIVKDLINCLNIEYSLSRIEYPFDQIYIERFFKSLKQELLYFDMFISSNDAYNKIYDYMNYYNYSRRHLAIYGYTPFECHYIYKTKSEMLNKYKSKLKEQMKKRIEFNK